MVLLSHLASTFTPPMHSGNAANVRGPIDMIFHNSPYAFMYSGAAAVGMFFVLSGFILSYCILSKSDVVDTVAGMTAKRYFRLLPPALGSCIIAFLIFKYIPVDNSLLTDWARNYGIKDPSLFNAIYSGTISSFFSGSSPYNWSLWTMKIEIFGSLMVFFLCGILPRIRIKKTIVIIAMIIPFFMNIKKGDDIYYAAFLSGVLIYLIKIKLSPKAGILILLTPPFLLAGLFFCGYITNGAFYKNFNYLMSIKIDGRSIDNYTLFNNIAGVIIIFSIIKTDFLSRILSHKFLVRMGALSFSVYVLHQPILYVTCPYIFNFMSAYGIEYSHAALIASVITVPIVYVLSIPYHNYVDIFSVKISNNIKNIVLVAR